MCEGKIFKLEAPLYITVERDLVIVLDVPSPQRVQSLL